MIGEDGGFGRVQQQLVGGEKKVVTISDGITTRVV